MTLDNARSFVMSREDRPVLFYFWAPWCKSCEKLAPTIDRIAVDYASRLTVICGGRQASFDEVRSAAVELLTSGHARWVYDDDMSISEAYAARFNPITVLVVGQVEVARWPGLAKESAMREGIDQVLALYPS